MFSVLLMRFVLRNEASEAVVPFIDSRKLQTSCVQQPCASRSRQRITNASRSPNNGAYFATVELAFLPPRQPQSVKQAFIFCHEKQGIHRS